MLAVMLLATAGLLGAMAMLDMTPDAEDADETEDLSVDETAAAATTDDMEGTEGDDALDIALPDVDSEGYATYFGPGLGLEYDDGDLTEIDAGDGDDTITVRSGNLILTTGAGADVVDASGMRDGLIFAEGADLVRGSDVVQGEYADNFAVLARDGADFEGGAAHETAIAEGNGSTLSGGAGNDVLMSDTGSADLRGGDGDDQLISNADDLRFSQASNSFTIDNYTDDSVDTLDGGAGNDRLEMSNGDVGTGGSGDDTFALFYNTADALPAGTITDFASGEDQIGLWVGGGEAGLPNDSSYDLTDRVDVIEADGHSYVTVDGEIAANVLNTSDLRIGIADVDARAGSYVDFETGVAAARDSFDVLVTVYQAR